MRGLFLTIVISIFVSTILITSTHANAGFWGGLDIDDMSSLQEKAYKAASSCDRREYLDACADFIKYFRDTVNLFKKYEDEIAEGIRKGDSSYIRILNRQKRLLNRSEQIR